MDIRHLSNVMNGKTDDENTNTPDEDEFLSNEEISGIDTSQSVFSEQPKKNLYDDEDDLEENDGDEIDDLEVNDMEIPSIYSQRPSSTINHYQSIDSQQQGFDIISGINDIPTKYRDENYIPELVAPSIQYNRIKNKVEHIEWQIKARNLIRKHQMYRPDYDLDERDIAGYTYMNDLLLSRANDGFERKMSNNNLNGVYEENASESAPSSPKRSGGLRGLFGNGGGGNY